MKYRNCNYLCKEIYFSTKKTLWFAEIISEKLFTVMGTRNLLQLWRNNNNSQTEGMLLIEDQH